jgi:hypothetical protein
VTYPVLEWAMGQAVPSTAKHVLLVLATHADKDGLCWPSVATIGAKSGLGERAIQTALRLLIGKGLIVVTANEKGGRGCTPRYVLQCGKGASAAPIEPERAHQPHPNSGLNGASAAPNRAKRVHQSTAKRVHLTTEKGAADAPELPRTSKIEELPSRREPSPPAYAPAREALPRDWLPSEEGEATALRLGLNLPRTIRMFRNRYLAHGTLLADWDAQWELWCDREALLAEQAAKQAPPVHRNGMIAMAVEMRQARQAGEEPRPVVNQFLVPGSTRNDH